MCKKKMINRVATRRRRDTKMDVGIVDLCLTGSLFYTKLRMSDKEKLREKVTKKKNYKI